MAGGGIVGGGGIDDAAMVVGNTGFAGAGAGYDGFVGATYGPGMVTTVFGEGNTGGRRLPLEAASASAKPAQSKSTVTQSQRSSSENDKGSCHDTNKER